jgi:hypothetical protein
MDGQRALTPDLKKYLGDVLDCEQALFTANRIKKNIHQHIKDALHAHETIEAPDLPTDITVDDVGGIDSGKTFRFMFGFPIDFSIMLLGTIIFWVLYSSRFGTAFFAFIGVVGIIGCLMLLIMRLFYGSSVEKINKLQSSEYKAAIVTYEESLENIKAGQEIIVDELNGELKKVDQLIIETQSTLDTLYSLDIIFVKYRHFVAVASFCEYIQSGRCDSLEGASGAYNLYESELRQNVIIGQLSAVIKGLAQIRDAQYMLYEAINESNNVLRDISGELGGIKTTTTVAAAASIATAYYARKSTKNSEILVDVNRGAYGFINDKAGRIVR